mgnify:CR=1 FL=1
MTTPPFRDRYLPFVANSGFHNLCYREWGDGDNPKVLICVHGLSRNRLDFDTLAAALADEYRVLAIDMPGRGGSDWLPDPADYNYPYFEYDDKNFSKVAHKEAYDWQDRLNISDYYEDTILWDEESLKMLIQNNLEK